MSGTVPPHSSASSFPLPPYSAVAGGLQLEDNPSSSYIHHHHQHHHLHQQQQQTLFHPSSYGATTAPLLHNLVTGQCKTEPGQQDPLSKLTEQTEALDVGAADTSSSSASPYSTTMKTEMSRSTIPMSGQSAFDLPSSSSSSSAAVASASSSGHDPFSSIGLPYQQYGSHYAPYVAPVGSWPSNGYPTSGAFPFSFYTNGMYLQRWAGHSFGGKKGRQTYARWQTWHLEKEFGQNRYITKKKRTELSGHTGLNDRQVKIWFQNRRMKQKKEKKRRDSDDTNTTDAADTTTTTAQPGDEGAVEQLLPASNSAFDQQRHLNLGHTAAAAAAAANCYYPYHPYYYSQQPGSFFYNVPQQ